MNTDFWKNKRNLFRVSGFGYGLMSNTYLIMPDIAAYSISSPPKPLKEGKFTVRVSSDSFWVCKLTPPDPLKEGEFMQDIIYWLSIIYNRL